MKDNKVIDGVSLARKIKKQLKVKVKELNKKNGIFPGLGLLIVGDDPSGKSY